MEVRAIGDKSYYAAPVLPLLVDSFVVSLLVRGDRRAAANLALLSVGAFSERASARELARQLRRHVGRRAPHRSQSRVGNCFAGHAVTTDVDEAPRSGSQPEYPEPDGCFES
ncbi:MAG TPA: hypothetical protein VJN18_33500 [Polyangiaceae bacterium]|nr:hypothetical protein [Polyangiaceae bacterium]